MFFSRAKVATMCAASFLSLAAWGSFNYIQSQEKPKKKDKEEIVETRGETGKKATLGKEIKNDTKENIAKRAGAISCDVHVDNRTNWIIHRVYIDGNYVGRVGRLGDLIEYDVLVGPTRIYAEADFTNGTVRTWGPTTFKCPSYTTYRWILQ